jgi:mersacidin/lichenicidin family type 2 lantibiotic
MANENKNDQHEHQPEEQPTTPAVSVELTDEELKQVTGGGIRVPDSPVTTFPPGPSIIAVL